MNAGEAGPLFPEEFLRRIERLSLAVRRGRGEGRDLAGRKGGRIEFADHRPYAPGDDPRFIDWHLYGRQGLLFLKEFAREERGEVAVVVDVSASMRVKIRAALRLAAALATVALSAGDRVRLGFAAAGKLRFSKPLTGEGKRAEALAELAANERSAGGGTDLDASLRALPPLPGPGRGLVVLVSDLLSDRDGRAALAARREEAAVLHLLAPEERAPPAYGNARLVSEEDGDLPVYAGEEAASLYRRACERWVFELAASCGRRGDRYVLVPAERPAEEVLLELLVAGGILE